MLRLSCFIFQSQMFIYIKLDDQPGTDSVFLLWKANLKSFEIIFKIFKGAKLYNFWIIHPSDQPDRIRYGGSQTTNSMFLVQLKIWKLHKLSWFHREVFLNLVLVFPSLIIDLNVYGVTLTMKRVKNVGKTTLVHWSIENLELAQIFFRLINLVPIEKDFLFVFFK